MAEDYDLVVLGGGTGGYVAAIRAAQLGMKTAIVEKERIGGTCLHRGCIPSKTLLKSAHVYATMKHGEEFGVVAEDVFLDYDKVHERKRSIISQLYRGVQSLLKKNDIDVYKGKGRILGPSIFSPLAGTISVERTDAAENDMLTPKYVLIATGSRPQSLPGLETDGESILSSNDVVDSESLPESILIVGGGVIGVEWASMYADFGVNVTVLELEDRILPSEDRDVSHEMARLLEMKGVGIITGVNVLPETMRKGKNISIRANRRGRETSFSAEKMLVSAGRQANTEGIGLENTNIKTKNRFIQTNEFYQTTEKHIYAIGDVIGGYQLAHVASHEGRVAVEHIAGDKPRPLEPKMIPRCIYANPEAASIGLTEAEAKNAGYDVKTGRFSFKSIGKALIHGDTDGFVKLITDQKTDDLLGVHIVGPHATEMISEAALARLLDAASWEVAEAIHPHPTLAEIMGEAALAVDGVAIHA